MKTKKFVLPIILLVTAILATAAYAVISSIAKKPTVTEGEFPFSITYELNGETVTVTDVYKVRYTGNGGYADTKSRVYVGEIGDMGEGNTSYTLKEDANGSLKLHTNFYADYLMGDTEYDYFDDEAFAPQIYYYDAEYREYGDEETLSAHGVKLISFEYPSPLENTLVFSHISYCNGEVVLPIMVIALLCLLAVWLFVKKDQDAENKTLHKISVVLNIVIGIVLLPFVCVVAMLVDIIGGGSEWYRQVLYFIPSFLTLCMAASVALRRKGYGKAALIAQLIGPAVFALYLIACAMCELL